MVNLFDGPEGYPQIYFLSSSKEIKSLYSKTFRYMIHSSNKNFHIEEEVIYKGNRFFTTHISKLSPSYTTSNQFDGILYFYLYAHNDAPFFKQIDELGEEKIFEICEPYLKNLRLKDRINVLEL